MTSWRLVADVGGSNVRFARSEAPRRLEGWRSYPLRDHESFYSALTVFLDESGGARGCASAAIGVAGPVDDGRVKLTNAPWTIEAAEVCKLLDGAPARLVNDLQAVAYMLPFLADEELIPIGQARRSLAPPRNMLAVNVGTGFGAALAIPAEGGWIANPGEPGHMSLGVVDKADLGLLEKPRSVEDLLSGRGLPLLYNTLAHHAGRPAVPDIGGARIFASAGEDPVAAETVRHFSRLLGRIAGDLALAMAAWGGVYLCGSVVNGWAAAGGTAHFREPFEAKSIMAERMRGVYSGIITRDDAALIGLTYLPV
ncbi:MAG: ROK family protein [Rhodomicrobium sp.]|nr:ROK family protein [Rhodomicrobium sp.]